MNRQNFDFKRDSKKKKFYAQFPYGPAIEKQMYCLYQLLSEKDRRLYAATESQRLGYGGITYLAKVFNCDRKTIYRGISELKQPDKIANNRIRLKGGGRKRGIETIPNLSEKFLKILKDYTAGRPR